MSSAAFVLYHQAFRSFLTGEFGAPATSKLSAHLLVPSFSPNPAVSATLETVAAYEVSGSGYQPQAVTGQSVFNVGGAWAVTSDSILFGDPVTLPPFRYAVFAYGLVNTPANNKPLLAYLDLSPNGGVREVVKGSFVIQPHAAGWFSITQP